MSATEQDVLRLIAIAATRGADAALAEAIEMGAVGVDSHIDSPAWRAAVRQAKADA